jgi:two-component system, cell cycle response regulator
MVVVTGQTGSADRVRSALAGCDAYLTKPLVEAQLIAALGEVDPLFN